MIKTAVIPYNILEHKDRAVDDNFNNKLCKH